MHAPDPCPALVSSGVPPPPPCSKRRACKAPKMCQKTSGSAGAACCACGDSGASMGGGMGGGGTAKTLKRPRQQPVQPRYANYWAPLTCRRHTMPHPAQPQHTNYWAPHTWQQHRQEHRPQRPTERSDPTQHAKGRTGDCPGPRKETTTRRNVTRGDGPGLVPITGCRPHRWGWQEEGGPSAGCSPLHRATRALVTH